MNPVTSTRVAQALNSVPRAAAAQFEQFFVYVPNNGALTVAQGASGTTSVTLQSDYDFALYNLNIQITDESTDAAIQTTAASSTLQVNDTGAGANWFSNPVGISSIAGNGQLPFITPVVRIVLKTATLNFTIANTKDGSTSGGAKYLIALVGTKLIPAKG